MTKVRMRQAWAIARVEMRRAFLSKRGLWVYLLALFPAASYLAHDVQMKFTEERWARHGRTSVQLVDSFTKGEKAEDILKRAPAPASDDSWTERRDDDGDRERDRERERERNERADRKQPGQKRAGREQANQERADREQATKERADREQANKDKKEHVEESVQRRVLTYYDGRRVVDLRFSDGVLQGKDVRPVRDFDKDRRIFAGIFQYFYLRLAIFFGCLGIFMNLFRGEMLDKTLHFWFLAPVRREVLLAGKYMAGIAAACVIFGGGALLGYAAMIWPHTGSGALAFQSAVGWSHAFWYVTAAVLGCLGYGSVFLAAGLLLRNPIIPAAVILLWESINGFLPALLQKLSVLYYLQSLCPEAAPMDENAPMLRLLLAPAAAASKSLSILGLLAVTALVLWAASRAVNRIEINYSTE